MTEDLTDPGEVAKEVAAQLMGLDNLKDLHSALAAARRMVLRSWIDQDVLQSNQGPIARLDTQIDQSLYFEDVQDNEKYFPRLRNRLKQHGDIEAAADIPVLLVLPTPSVKALMERIRLDGATGYTFLDQDDIDEA